MEVVFHVMLMSDLLGNLVVSPGTTIMNVFVKDAVGLVCPLFILAGLAKIG